MIFESSNGRDDKCSEYDCSFFCLDTKERTKEKIKATGKMAENFSASLKQIKYIFVPHNRVNPYLFFNALLRNFLNAIFPGCHLVNLSPPV